MPELSEDHKRRIQEQLDRILGSTTFAGSDRHRQFLRFVVEQALKDNTDKLNEFVLGFEVFNKTDSFDPRIDSIVRVEARRLRERLKKYYLDEGPGDPIVITLKPRSFVPAFEDAAVEELPPPARLRAWLPSHKTVVIALVALLCGAIATVALLRFRRGRPLLPPPTTAIIVLPFQSLAPASDQESLGDGIADGIITGLTGVPGLRVISRGSSIQIKESGRSPGQFAADLRVDYVVEGTVLVKQSRAVVSAKMTDTHSQSYVWAETQEVETESLPELERRLVNEIASRVHLSPGPDTGERPLRRASPEAYAAFLKGQYYWYQWDGGGVEKSIELFEQAIRQDPGYAPAWAWLSQSYLPLILGSDGQDAAVIAKGRQAAMKALSLDDQLAEAHTAAGSYAALDWEWSNAERGFKRGIQLNSGWAYGHLAYAMFYLVPTGHVREATGEMLRAHELDPLTKFTSSMLAEAWYFNREYGRAIAQYDDLRKPAAGPSPMDARYFLALAFAGQASRAKAELAKVVTDDRSPAFPVLGYLQARYGDRQQARGILQQLVARSQKEYVPPVPLAMVSAGLGDKDEAFRQLRFAVAKHSPSVSQFAADPVFDSLHSDPRYAEILRAAGLTSRN